MRNIVVLTALMMCAGFSLAVDENVTKTETKSETVSTAGGSTTTSETVTTNYETRLRDAYQAAEIEADKLDKLIILDNRIREAKLANDTVKVTEYTTQRNALVTPPQIEKVRVYLREHPARVPAEQVIVWEETTPAAGIQVNTPLGSVGVGAPATTTRVEKHVVEPRP